MRLFLYVSKANEVHRLSGILSSAKSNNRANGITGIMSYNDGQYLQAIEGDSNAVQSLIDKLQKDTRHQQMQTILDVETSHRYFSKWSMNLVPLLRRHREFKTCVADHLGLLQRLNKQLGSRFSAFYPSLDITTSKDNRAVPSVQKSPRNLLAYSINHWPNFGKVEVSPNMLTLCGVLLNSPVAFESLCQRQIFADETALKDALKQLRRAGCLTISQLTANTTKQAAPHLVAAVDVPVSSFMEKMRDFLSARLH